MIEPNPLRGRNFFDLDQDLQFVLAAKQPGELNRWRETLSDFGAWVAGPLDEQATYTDRHGRPKLISYGADAKLANHVQYNPLWQRSSQDIYAHGIVGLNYGQAPASYLITFIMGYMTSQSDVSLHCPATMTGAVAHVLNRFAPADIKDRYLPDLIRTDGQALSAGTWATEHHGGSDIGATTTSAHYEEDHVLLNGLKWFTSNVDGGISVATARPQGSGPGSPGLGLYLIPTVLPDGTANTMRIRRLKEKLGTNGVATAEVDLTDTYALEIAPPPDGFKLMMEALEFSRIHNAMSAAGLQRRALWESLCFARNRQAFGHAIIDYPMVQNELIMMRVELDADLALAMEAGHAFDQGWQTDVTAAPVQERTWLRLVTALAKYRTAENANTTCRAAIELIGGNGYTYDFITPRLLSDAQVLTVWEGPANIQALEVLRLLDPRYGGWMMFEDKLKHSIHSATAERTALASTLKTALDECTETVTRLSKDQRAAQRYARRVMDRMSNLLAAALVLDQAERDAKAGGSRKTHLARAFISKHLEPAGPLITADHDDWLFDVFDELMGPDLEALGR